MTESRYRLQIHNIVLGLWKGVLTPAQFSHTMESAIASGMRQAWEEGATDCGIAMDELSGTEQVALNEMTTGQFEFIEGLSDFIQEASDKPDSRSSEAINRSDLWINRYAEARNQARAMACADGKLKWQNDIHCREHCSSCVKLNGKVKRGSYWASHVMPRSRDLECGGWRCCCELVPTNEPVSRGRLSF